MTYQDWNIITKDSETDEVAYSGDIVTEINGIIYLIQRKNDCNNVICYRVYKTDSTLLSSFIGFRNFCIDNNIQYIRVEGNKRRYNFLKKLKFPGYQVAQDFSETDRNVFYIKLY